MDTHDGDGDGVAASLGAGRELRALLPALLRDLWALGCSTGPLLRLMRRSALAERRDVRVLDLGCGKGAALIELATAHPELRGALVCAWS